MVTFPRTETVASFSFHESKYLPDDLQSIKTFMVHKLRFLSGNLLITVRQNTLSCAFKFLKYHVPFIFLLKF